ncbi:MAG TPA: Rid family detoxifying hydrolase [Steroidobacteraceae bacterium]|nr:Rid family detoxifying hydrolase [Steroidobacteraceae bacterium]
MPREAINCREIAPPVGPFSPAVSFGEFVFLSGQVAQDPSTSKLVAGDVSAQAEQIFRNLGAVLRASGRTFADVVRVGVYLTNIADYPAMNAVYARHFEAPYPARTAIAVAALPLGASIEIDLIAR